MNRKIIFLSIIIAAVCCAAGLFYWQQTTVHQKVLADEYHTGVPQDRGTLFPLPEKTQYEMKLYFDPVKRMIYGSSLIQTVNNQNNDMNEIWLTIYPNVFKDQTQTPAPLDAYAENFDPGWLTIEDVQVNQKEAVFQEEGISCKITLADPIPANKNLVIEMTWQVKIPRVKYRFGYQDGAYMLGNFYPILDVFDGKEWHNSYNSNFGDPFCFASASYLASINIPQEYQIASSGQVIKKAVQDDGREIQIIQAENARDLGLVILDNHYDQLSLPYNRMQIKVYFPDKYGDVSDMLASSADMLDYYSCQFGSYPYKEFKVVFVPMQGFHGMEYSGLVLLREDILQDGYNAQRKNFLLAHEIAHQWWYAMVGNDQLREPWLDEGLANWSAYKYLQERKGIEPPKVCVSGINLRQEMQQIYSQQEYYDTIYNGGESFWSDLENQLGEETILKILRRYVATYRFQIASTDDLLEIIKLEANRDLKDYFARWFSD